MRLRKLIVLGALVAFTGGMMSCSKKAETPAMDSTAQTPPPPPATPAPQTPATADSNMKAVDSSKKAADTKATEMHGAEKKGEMKAKDDMKKK